MSFSPWFPHNLIKPWVMEQALENWTVVTVPWCVNLMITIMLRQNTWIAGSIRQSGRYSGFSECLNRRLVEMVDNCIRHIDQVDLTNVDLMSFVLLLFEKFIDCFQDGLSCTGCRVLGHLSNTDGRHCQWLHLKKNIRHQFNLLKIATKVTIIHSMEEEKGSVIAPWIVLTECEREWFEFQIRQNSCLCADNNWTSSTQEYYYSSHRTCSHWNSQEYILPRDVLYSHPTGSFSM